MEGLVLDGETGGALGAAGRVLLGLVESAALGAARIYGFILVFPVFAWLGIRGFLHMAVAIGLSIPMLQPIFLSFGDPAGGGLASDAPTWLLVALTAKEIVLGVLLGLLMGAPFWAAEVAGAYVDYYRGAVIATTSLPRPEGEILTTGATLQIALIAVFMATIGLPGVLGVLYGSFEVWPVDAFGPPAIAPLSPFVVSLLGEMFVLALALAAPLLITMALAEAALAFCSRLSPRLNVFDATLSIKSLVLLAILPIYFYAFVAHYADVASTPDEIGARLLEAVRGAAQGGGSSEP